MESPHGRGIARDTPFVIESPDEKKQLIHRLPPEFARSILRDFNSGAINAASAAARLNVSRTRLYVLRTAWLKSQSDFQPTASGGNHGEAWPAEIIRFLTGFLHLQIPPNFQLVAGEMERLHGFKRARSTVEDYVKNNLTHLIPQPQRKPRTCRRFQRAHVGELWQHDSSIHQWRPASNKKTLLLTTDDCSGLFVVGRFVESDTTWNHFEHFCEAFERHGLPQVIHTDGLSLFGPSSSHDHSDPKSKFQRALHPLHVAHIVAPTPQAKGKIERRFGTFQRRLVTLMVHEKFKTWQHADEILQMEIQCHNRKTLRTTGYVPAQVWEEQILKRSAQPRPTPECSLLVLHFSLRAARKGHLRHIIQFDGREFRILLVGQHVRTLRGR